MVGKLDDNLFIAHGTDTLTITGTVTPSALSAAAGDRVRVEVVQLTQGERSVSCNRDFLIVDPGVDLAWSMVVSASHFVSGSAASNTQATLRPRSGSDGQPQGWQQTVEITKN